MQFEIPLRTSTTRCALQKPRHSLYCDPAPAQEVDFAEVGAAAYFIPNETEAEITTGMSVKSIGEAKKCAEFLLRQGMQRVVITLGERGSLVAGMDGMEHVPAFKVQPLIQLARVTRSSAVLRFSLGRNSGEGSLCGVQISTPGFHYEVGTQKSFCPGRSLKKSGKSAAQTLNPLCQGAKMEFSSHSVSSGRDLHEFLRQHENRERN